MPYAFVKLNIDGQDLIATDYGVGPVDAALNAIQKSPGKSLNYVSKIMDWHQFPVVLMHYVRLQSALRMRKEIVFLQKHSEKIL